MIVKAFDPINDVEPCLSTRFVSELIHALDFQRLEEALHDRVISAVGFATHRLSHLEVADQRAMAVARVLAAGVGVQDQSRLGLALPIR